MIKPISHPYIWNQSVSLDKYTTYFGSIKNNPESVPIFNTCKSTFLSDLQSIFRKVKFCLVSMYFDGLPIISNRGIYLVVKAS
jgi:hypothetical protein